MEDEYNTAKKQLRIDMLDLETEFIEHPSRMQSVIECTTDMMQVRDTCNAALKQVTAEASARLRVPGEDGKMPSEANINSRVPSEFDVIAAAEQLAEAEHDLRYWQGLAESYRAKGSSLKHISELTVAGWLAPNHNRKQELATLRNAAPTPQQFISKRK